MQKIITLIFVFVVIVSCKETKDSKKNSEKQPANTKEQVATDDRSSDFCETSNFDSPAAQAEVLLARFEQLKTVDDEARKKLEKAFFCTFPDSFETMQQLFGFQDDTEAPLYDHPVTNEMYKNNHISNDIIGYFSKLQSIPVNLYFKKYIDICNNGRWEADNITQGFGLVHRMLTDSKAACQVLKIYSDKEIKSVFRFFFDGPHPKNDYNAKLYDELLKEVEKNDENLAKLLTNAYTELLATIH